MTKPIKIACIPDTQVKPDQDLSYLRAIGNYIVEKQPDAVVHLGDFADMPSLCVAPDTAVLRGDFSWSRAEDLRIGDDIIGFIGGKPGGKGKSFRKLRPGKVTNNTRFVAKSGYKITTEHGTVVCSHDHKFMSYNDDGAKRAFRTCAQLRVGWKIMSLGSDWLQPSGLTPTELGYLAGFLDGEGSYAQGRLTWSQNDGAVASYVLTLFDKLQVEVGYYSEVGRPNLKHYYVKGSYLSSWKVLHYCRPVRLLPKLIADMDGKTCSKFSGSKDSSIVSIEPLEGVEVIGLETDVNTYISNSLFSHNCSYDKGRKSFEGRRYKHDIEAAKEGMRILLDPLYTYNDTHTRNKKRKYQPYMLMLLGNHEHRITRAVEDDAKLDGTIGLGDLGYESFGWEVSPFLKVEQVAGICFSHYFVSGVMGRPITSAQALLTKKHVSCIAGHQQGKQIATATRGDGKRITGIITGSCYPGQEEYLGPQGNEHWRGMLMCYEAIEGQFDEGFISLDYLRSKYG